MAQSGYTPILIYASGTASNVPLAANLTSSASGAELALNYADGKLYYKNSSGVVTLLAGATAGPAGGSNTQVQFNSSGVLAGSASLTWDGTVLTSSGFAGPLNGTVGATTPASGAFTTVSASGVATFSAGTVSAPAITTTGDTNTGIYFPAADTIAFTEGGAESMRIDADGDVGIGTSSPAYKLDVVGGNVSFTNSGSGSALYLNKSTTPVGDERLFFIGFGANTDLAKARIHSSSESAWTAGTSTPANLVFNTTPSGSTNPVERMRITSSGDVGIGTSSPAFKLDVSVTDTTAYSTSGYTYEPVRITNSGAGGVSGILFQALSTGTANTAQATISAIAESASSKNTAITFGTRENAGGTLPERMRIDSSGNLGLGVTPSAWGGTFRTLQLPGGSSISGTTDPTLQITQNGFYNGTNWIYSTTAPVSNYYQSAGTHVWRTAPSGTAGNAITFTQAMTLDASGLLQIGTTSNTGGGRVDALSNATSVYTARSASSGAGTTVKAVRSVDSGASNFSNAQYDALSHAWILSNSTQAMTLDSSGNVGIGTSSPGNNLEVYGTAASTAIEVNGTGRYRGYEIHASGTRVGYLQDDSTDTILRLTTTRGTLTFATGDVERMRLDSSGNLGIGTSTPAGNLQISGSGDRSLLVTGGTAGTVSVQLGDSGAAGQGGMSYDNSVDALFFKSNGSERMRISSTGSLLLGTTTDTNFEVSSAGHVTFTNATSPTDNAGDLYRNGIGWQAANQTTNVLSALITAQNSGSYGADTLFLKRGTAGGALTESMRIDSGGNLLVGRTSLSLGNVGTILNASGTLTVETSFTGTNEIANFNQISTGTTQIDFRYQAVASGYIEWNSTTTSYITSSDYRLKNTVAPMTDALAKVALLKPCTYKWNADGSDGEGFIAHELAEVCPQAVSGKKDAVDKDGNPKYQGVDTSFLVATLTAAIQEQQALIQDLTTRLAALEAK
jgi:hypothetical protein